LLEPDSSDSGGEGPAPAQRRGGGERLDGTAESASSEVRVEVAELRLLPPAGDGLPAPSKRQRLEPPAPAVGLGDPGPAEPVALHDQLRNPALHRDTALHEMAELELGVRVGTSLKAFLGPDEGLAPRWSEGPLVLTGGAVLPERIAGCLRKYQREGVRWLYERLFEERRGCLLADEMGLGKTVQVACCLVAGLYARPKPEGEGENEEKVGPVLVLCPPTLIQNWARELRRWGPFSLEVLPSAVEGRVRALRRVDAGLADVLVASRGLLRGDDGPAAEGLLARTWGCVVVDEVHQARNPKGQLHRALCSLKSPRKVGLTGTPLQNSLSDVWALLRGVGAHANWDLSAFEARFSRPIAKGQKRKASVKDLAVREDALKEFNDLFKGSVLRRTKDDVALMLPGKNDRIVPCPLSDVQRAAYRNLIASADFQMALGRRQLCVCGAGRPCLCGAGPVWRYVHQRQAEQKGLEDEWAAADDCVCRGRCPPKCLSLSLIVVLQRLTNHIEQLKPDTQPPKDSAEQAQQQLMKEICDIAFAGVDHNLCTQRRVANRLLLGSPEACGKMQVLLPLLLHWRRKGQKVLVFSRSTRLLDILEACLWQQGWSPQVLRLDGGTPPGQRQRLVDEFNASSTRGVFLISTKAGGIGLNLTAASVVVIFDPDWNPFSDLQAQDRSFRIGQTRVVEVYRLLGAGTIEEQVYVRQVWKQQLAAMAIDGTRSARRLDGASFGLGALFELHEGSMLPVLMAEAFKERAQPKVSSENGVQVFDDVRGAAAADMKLTELVHPESDREADDGEEDRADSDAAPEPERAEVGATQALERLHGMFDQVDHSKVVRNDTQENLLLMDLNEEAEGF